MMKVIGPIKAARTAQALEGELHNNFIHRIGVDYTLQKMLCIPIINL